jgi:hypothetical protein
MVGLVEPDEPSLIVPAWRNIERQKLARREPRRLATFEDCLGDTGRSRIAGPTV